MSGWARILADEPLLSRLCTDFGARPSFRDTRDLEHPLLVFAHSRSLGWAGGLATLEKMLAQTESPNCRVAILGFLPLGRYRELEYLVNYFNYRQLPSTQLPSPESDQCLVKENARRQARRNRTSSEHRRVSHDLRGLLLDEKLSKRYAVRSLLDTRATVFVPEMRDLLENVLDRLRSAQPPGIRAILSDCYSNLQILRGKQ